MYLPAGNTMYRNNNLSLIPTGSQQPTDVGWERLEDINTGFGVISALEVTYNSRYLYYGTSSGEMRRLTDPSETFPGSDESIQAENLPGGNVICIASNPEDDEEILVVYSNYNIPSLFHSLDGGQTYTDVSGNLEEFPDGSGNGPSTRWAEIVPIVGGKRFFVGTSVGLYSTELLDGDETTWAKESPELIGKSIVKMIDYRPSDGTLVIGTHGNGAFRAQVDSYKSISELPEELPNKLRALTAYPNPFSETTRIEFELPEPILIQVDIYDIHGRYIKMVFVGPQFAGKSYVEWDGTDQQGNRVSEGIYLYRVRSNDFFDGGQIVYSP